MHNKVVFRAAGALNDAGMIALRINFRGVGQSTGEHDDGRGELEDVRAGLAYLVENYPGPANHNLRVLVWCVGGFGSRTARRARQELISIGTPVGKYDFSFLKACSKPILFVHGDRDEFGAVSELQLLVDQIKKHNPAVDLNIISSQAISLKGVLTS